MNSGFVFDIKRFALHDGPGLRTTVFLKGCPLSCLGCHNPEGQRVGPELLFRPDRCTACGDCLPACPTGAISWAKGASPPSGSGPERSGPAPEGSGQTPGPILVDWDRCELSGACVEACLPGALDLVGRRSSPEEILRILEEDRIYYDESRGGVTFSGGEPFSQPDFLREVLQSCLDRELPVVLDTCGHVAPETFRELAPLAAGILFDLKLVDGDRHEAFTGVHNRWILENLRWVGGGCGDGNGGIGGNGPQKAVDGGVHPPSRGCPSLTVRIPLIPGVNDDEENLRATAELLTQMPHSPPVDILPYHRLGVDKYHRMGRDYHLSQVAPPAKDSVQKAARLLEEVGLVVTVRGEKNGDD